MASISLFKNWIQGRRRSDREYMYWLLFLYLKIGYKGEGAVIENILKSKNNTEVGSL